MKQDNQKIYIMAGIFLIVILAGFYFVLNYLNGLNNQIQNLQSQIQLNNQTMATATTTPTSSQAAPNPPALSNNNPDVPTSIIFNTQSSPLLTPQTTLTVTIQDVSKTADGTITVDIKVFSNVATSYSSLNPSDLFQLVDLTNGNQNPLTVTGQFNSIPPQSAVTGSLIFKTDPANNKIILQVGSGDQIKFYQFDFNNQTYKETILG